MARAGRRLTVRGRLYGISAVGAVLTAVIGVVGLSGYSRLNAANEAELWLGTTQASTLEVLALQHKIRAQVWFAYAASAGGTDRPTAEIREEFEGARERLLANNAQLSTLADGTDHDQEFQALAVAENTLISHAETLIDLAFADRRAGLAQLGDFEDEADALDAQVSELSAQLTRERVAQSSAARAVERDDTRTLIAAATVGALLVVGLSALLARSILRALRRISAVAYRIGAGELDARCVVDGSDEISALASAFNDTADTLSDTMRRLTSEARREGLGSQLSEAFEMADTEAETYAVIERTMRLLAPGHPTELLLADSSKAHLTRRTANAAGDSPCCPVSSPFGCVAVRRGNPVVFEDSDALNACPK
ncbi:MAG TPA: HAMP domain-containing protein, partial [Catenuloplanes sp.]